MTEQPTKLKSDIYFFLKFCECKDYADEFIAGRVFCNRLSKYKKNEHEDIPGRIDTDEGTFLWSQPGKGRLVVNGTDISNSIASPIKMQKHWLNNMHLLCLYTGRTRDLENDPLADVDTLRRELVIPDECLALGDYAVFIHSVNEFIQRVQRAAGSRGFRIDCRPVNYFDHAQIDDIDSLFRKQTRYDFQREFRFIIDSNSIGEDAITLDVGDISDITLRFHSSQLQGDNWTKNFAWD